MQPVLFTIGPVSILSYGVIFVISLFLTLFIVWRLYKNNFAFLRSKVTLEQFFDSILVYFLSFGVGARLLHILEHWSTFQSNPMGWFLFLHYPGFSFLGGVIGGLIGLWLFCRYQKLPFFLFGDVISVGIAFALGATRLGSLLNGDAYGKATDFFFRVTLANVSGGRHATQVYESLLAFFVFALLYHLYRKEKTRPGMIMILSFLFIGIVRFLVEFLRGDSVYFLGIAIAHIISVIFVCVSLGLLISLKQDDIIGFFSKARRLRGK